MRRTPRPSPLLCTTLAASLFLAAGAGAQGAAVAENAATRLNLETFDRVWELVRDTHFDPDMGGLDWDAVREELRPHAEEAESRDELRGVLSEMLGRLKLSHFGILPEEGAAVIQDTSSEVEEEPAEGTEGDGADSSAPEGDGEAPGDPGGDPQGDDDDDDDDVSDREGDTGMQVRRIAGRILVVSVDEGSPADAAGIVPGCELIAVGKTDLAERLALIPEGLEPRLADYYAMSMVQHRLGGLAGTKVRVTLVDASGDRVEHLLKRRVSPGDSIQFGNLPPMLSHLTRHWLPEEPDGLRIGTFSFNVWMVPLSRQINEAVKEFRKADGIILDLRGNPGGVGGMAMGVAGHFIGERVELGTMKARTNTLHFNVAKRARPYPGPLAILVDGATGSTSEIFAAGLQFHGRAHVLGQTSMGAALPAMMERLPNGDVLLHAVADYVLPDGSHVEGTGVVPDEPVVLARELLLADPDPVMTAARKWIAEQVRSGSSEGKDSKDD